MPDSPAYSHFEKIGPDGWDPADLLMFDPMPADSADAKRCRYDITMIVRYSTRKSIQPLPVVITIDDETGTLLRDTVAATLFDDNGHAVGKGAYGVSEVEIPIAAGATLSEGYQISAAPLLQREYSKGLLNVGVVMRETGTPRTRKFLKL